MSVFRSKKSSPTAVEAAKNMIFGSEFLQVGSGEAENLSEGFRNSDQLLFDTFYFHSFFQVQVSIFCPAVVPVNNSAVP